MNHDTYQTGLQRGRRNMPKDSDNYCCTWYQSRSKYKQVFHNISQYKRPLCLDPDLYTTPGTWYTKMKGVQLTLLYYDHFAVDIHPDIRGANERPVYHGVSRSLQS